MQQKVILILEDSPEWLMLYKTVSESLDCLVFVAENGIAGLDLLQSIPMPDLILLDLDMPKMNGLEFFLNFVLDGSNSKHSKASEMIPIAP